MTTTGSGWLSKATTSSGIAIVAKEVSVAPAPLSSPLSEARCEEAPSDDRVRVLDDARWDPVLLKRRSPRDDEVELARSRVPEVEGLKPFAASSCGERTWDVRRDGAGDSGAGLEDCSTESERGLGRVAGGEEETAVVGSEVLSDWEVAEAGCEPEPTEDMASGDCTVGGPSSG